MRRFIFSAAIIGVLASVVPPSAPMARAEAIFVDSGADAAAWSTAASPGAAISLRQEQAAGASATPLRADFDLGHGRTHALLRRNVSIDLPDDYMFVVRLRGQAAPNTIEFKIISGENVWWRRFPDHEFARDGQDLRISRSRVEFAWGPAGGGMPRHIDAIEIAIVAGQGGAGTLWLDELRLERRQSRSAADQPPAITATSSAPGTTPAAVLDGRAETVWRSAPADAHPALVLDFHDQYEHGGLIIDQDTKDYAQAYVVEASADARAWTQVRRFTRSNGGRDYIYLPDLFARYLRLRFSVPGRTVAIHEIHVQPFEFSSSPNQFFSGIAADAAPGLYPRYVSGEQSYWTVVGAPAGANEALINEEGMLEVDTGSFSIEPFLWSGGRLLGWKQGRHTPSLEDGELPIPTVQREHDGMTLAVTAFADNDTDGTGNSTIYARYRVTNTAQSSLHATLMLALRHFQVLPPWQQLNMVGGAARITHISMEKTRSHEAPVLRVEDGREHRVTGVTPWSRFGASAFEQGDVSSFLARGVVPPATTVDDAFGYASGAVAYDLQLAPGASTDTWIAIDAAGQTAALAARNAAPAHAAAPKALAARNAAPAHAAAPKSLAARNAAPAHAAAPKAPTARTAAAAQDLFTRTRQQWRDIVSRIGIELPAAGADLVHSMRANLAYVLVNRDGPAIQPGSRTYTRSWIRDGALTSRALLEFGFDDEVRDFLRWYAGFQRDDGWIPCCVDKRGADPVPEHDSFGEFIWAVGELYRHTGDAAFVREMFPHVSAAAECMLRLRAKTMTPEYRDPQRIAFYGLLPESISHEGYSSRPVHSYWDDMFALRGLMDASMLAGVAGDEQRKVRYGAEAESFRATLEASIEATRTAHHLDTIPASAELADFDPTSTAIAFVLGLEDVYPAGPLLHSFDQYVGNVRGRASGATRGVGYTAYELRNVPALTLLGRKREALEVLMTMVADQRPPAWHQWPEISWLDPREPAFLGDLPHSWIGSTFLNATRTLLVYERSTDASLVLGAGVPLDWLQPSTAGEVVARGLSTAYGDLSYRIGRMQAGKDERIVVDVQAGITIPPGGVVVTAPFGKPVRTATIDGTKATIRDGEVRVRRLPARVEFELRDPASSLRLWGLPNQLQTMPVHRQHNGAPPMRAR